MTKKRMAIHPIGVGVNHNMDYEKALKGITLLCCEDEPEARKQLELLFKNRFAAVAMAEDGEKGLELYKKFKPDLVVSDIKMPRMTGLEMAREIRELNPKAQIILLTAFDYKNFFLDAIDIGVSQYVQKPIGERKLFDAIYRCLDLIVAEKKIDYQIRYIQNLLDAQKNLLFVTDGVRLLTANKSMVQFSGFDTVDSLVTNAAALNERVFYEDYSLNKPSWIETVYANRMQKKKRIVLVYPSGNRQFFTVNVSVLPDFKNRFLVSLTNISLVKNDTNTNGLELPEIAEEEAEGIDILTGALDRYSIFEAIRKTQTLAKRPPIIMALYLNDLEKINGEYDHSVGDAVLKKSLQLLEKNLDNSYTIGRLFGGTFIIIPPTTDIEQIKSTAVKLKQTFASKRVHEHLQIGCSVKLVKCERLENYDAFLKSISPTLLAMKNSG